MRYRYVPGGRVVRNGCGDEKSSFRYSLSSPLKMKKAIFDMEFSIKVPVSVADFEQIPVAERVI